MQMALKSCLKGKQEGWKGRKGDPCAGFEFHCCSVNRPICLRIKPIWKKAGLNEKFQAWNRKVKTWLLS